MLLCNSASDVLPDCPPGNDRPIGINSDSCAGDSFSSGSFRSWCDLTVVLTREGIEKALTPAAQVGGIPPGVIVVPLADTPGVDPLKGGLDGNYEMYLAVERLP